MSVLNDDILDSSQHYTYVVIDDLDRDWVDEQLANDLVRCLFRTVLELKRVRNLKVLVALRTNIFDQLNLGSRTGGQEEKFRSLSLQMKWSRSELIALLDERAKAAAVRFGGGPVDGIYDLLPVPNTKRGNAAHYILDRTLMRPRDAIAYVNECFNTAAGKTRLSWDDIKAAERPYSHKRLLALRDEWSPSYPGLESALKAFKGAPLAMTRDELTKRLDAIALLSADRTFIGGAWLLPLVDKLWSPSDGITWIEAYQPLVKFLYRIGLIGCARSATTDCVYSYAEPDLAEGVHNLHETAHFSVHPAFRPALDIEEPAAKGRHR